MKKNLFIILVIIIVITSATKKSFTYDYGPPAGYVNIKGYNCTSCHYGSLNPSGGSMQVTVSGQTKPYFYKLDSWYTINVIINDSKAKDYGFECALVDNSAGYHQAGKDSVFQSNTSITSYIRDYVIQNTAFGTNKFSFLWKAPHTGNGIIRAFACGNGGDGNYDQSNDHIYAVVDTLYYKSVSADIYNVVATEPLMYYYGNKFYIKLPADYSTSSNLIIYDLNGHAISNKAIFTDMSIDMKEYPSGIYISTISDISGIKAIRKFIKE